jgi:hypothetical protein
MEKSKLNKIELEFSEARKEIMKLRQDNRKLESAITMLSKPMMLSDDEAENVAVRSSSGSPMVIALPQGDAKDRIDDLLAENSKLADEIVELRKITSSDSGVASLIEKNEKMTKQIRVLEARVAETENIYGSNVKQMQTRHELEKKQLKTRNFELESVVSELRSQIVAKQDESDNQLHELKLTVSKLERGNSVLSEQLDFVYKGFLCNSNR